MPGGPRFSSYLKSKGSDLERRSTMKTILISAAIGTFLLVTAETATACTFPNGTYNTSGQAGAVHFVCRGYGECQATYGTELTPGRLSAVFTRQCTFVGEWIGYGTDAGGCSFPKYGNLYWGQVLFQFNADGNSWAGWVSNCSAPATSPWNGWRPVPDQVPPERPPPYDSEGG
jgi:hypothetical protein